MLLDSRIDKTTERDKEPEWEKCEAKRKEKTFFRGSLRGGKESVYQNVREARKSRNPVERLPEISFPAIFNYPGKYPSM
jgi:hypothetical protein